MKFKKLKFSILILFILPQYTLSYDKLEYYVYCNQIPEGNPFGLIFKDNEVAQIGIENFEKLLDYKENFRKKGNYAKSARGYASIVTPSCYPTRA